MRYARRSRAPARWREYASFLDDAREHGYEIIDLEQWIANGRPRERSTLVMRHDVDQHPRSALRMARIEQEREIRSTWYFRWRTADPRVIARLRKHGLTVGLHYETLTRRVRETAADPSDPETIADCRRELRAEIATFAERFGPIRSVCPHGDTRVPGVENALLLRDEPADRYGITFDSNEAMRGAELGLWLTDRTLHEGGWRDGIDPQAVFDEGINPILAVVHPNNWAAGSGLLVDRALGVFPTRIGTGPIRTLSDRPPPLV